jgi:hypothetical protein
MLSVSEASVSASIPSPTMDISIALNMTEQ